MEGDGEGNGFAAGFADEGFGGAVGAEQFLGEGCFGGHHHVAELFVLGKFHDQREDDGQVGACGGADVQIVSAHLKLIRAR